MYVSDHVYLEWDLDGWQTNLKVGVMIPPGSISVRGYGSEAKRRIHEVNS